MSSYLIIPLVEVAFCLGLLIALAVGGLRHVARRPFAAFLICMGLWGFFIFMMRFSSTLSEAFFWEQFVFLAILSAALFFYRFTIGFTGVKQSKRVLYPLLSFYVLFMALVPTGLVVSRMQMMWYGKAPIVGPLFFPYVLCVYAFIIAGLIVLLRHYKRTRILDEKIRISYVTAGIIIMFIGGTTDYLPPLGINIYPLGIIGNIMFCLLATVAMLRYGLLEFRFVLRKGATIALVSMFIIGIIGLVTFVLNTMLGSLELHVILLIITITILAMAPVVQPVASRVQHVVDRWFYGDRYHHLQALESFSREAKDIVDLGDLSSSLLAMIAHATHARDIYLLLPSPRTGNFITYSHHGENGAKEISFPASSLISQTMQYQDGLIDINDIDVIPSLRAISESDRQTLMKNEIELLVPLKAKERLTGMLLLSSRISGKSYSTDDRRLLETVAHHAAMAIENARLYEELKQQLISSSKLASLGELAAYVAHEVNNGLQSVINFGAILREDMKDDDSRKEDCKAIEAEALRARNIVETLLGIVRRERVGKGAVDINNLLRSVATLARLRAKTENITLTENYSREPLLVEGSPEQLRQVFLNLFGNATDAMANGGKIEIETAARDKEVVITVADTGVGIPSHTKDKIFDPLFTTKPNGTGLGLTVSLSIIRDHGGTLSVNSVENKGTKFIITLPQIEQREE